MSNLEQHAEFELRRAGLFDKDSDYHGMIGVAVMKLIRVYAAEGHSGASAAITRGLFARLANFKTLSPLTSDPSEWVDVAEVFAGERNACWQNKRCPSCFSKDGGKTYYDIDAGDNRAIKTSEEPTATPAGAS